MINHLNQPSVYGISSSCISSLGGLDESRKTRSSSSATSSMESALEENKLMETLKLLSQVLKFIVDFHSERVAVNASKRKRCRTCSTDYKKMLSLSEKLIKMELKTRNCICTTTKKIAERPVRKRSKMMDSTVGEIKIADLSSEHGNEDIEIKIEPILEEGNWENEYNPVESMTDDSNSEWENMEEFGILTPHFDPDLEIKDEDYDVDASSNDSSDPDYEQESSPPTSTSKETKVPFVNGGRTLRCRFCTYHTNGNGKVPNIQFFKKHMLRRHKNLLMHTCSHDGCLSSFASDILLSAHAKGHEELRPIACQLCPIELTHMSPKKCMNTEELNDHLYESHVPMPPKVGLGAPRECHLCPMKFKEPAQLRKHIKRSHHLSDPMLCPYCPKKLKRMESLEKHCLWKHEFNVPEEEKQLTCPEAACLSKRFAIQEVLTRHMRLRNFSNSSSKRRCVQCDQKFPTDDTFRNHACPATTTQQWPRASQWKCLRCPELRVFATRRTYLSHERLHHPELLIYVCTQCPKQYSTQSFLQTHMKTHGDDNEEKDAYMCQVCKVVMQNRHALEEHLAYHNGEDNDSGYNCELCGKVLQHREAYANHMDRNHKDKGVIQCQVFGCGKIFTQRGGLLGHMKYVHKDKSVEEKHPCPTCAKVFSDDRRLKCHLRTHNEARSMCPDCGAMVKNLDEHRKRIHERVKNFKCQFCPKDFYTKAELKVHLSIHTGEKHYKCEFCESAFTQSHCLAKHKKKYH